MLISRFYCMLRISSKLYSYAGGYYRPLTPRTNTNTNPNPNLFSFVKKVLNGI